MDKLKRIYGMTRLNDDVTWPLFGAFKLKVQN